MKNLFLISVVLLISLTTFAQNFTKTNRDVTEFNSIKLDCSADVYISQGNEISVIVETEEKNQNKVKTFVANNKLIIEISARIFTSKRLNVYVTVKDLSIVNNEGSGDFEFKTPLKTANFIYKSEGSGDFEIDKIITNKFISIQEGSGDCEISGDIKVIDAKVEGSGNFEAENVNLTNCNIVMEGSGDVELKGISNIIKVVQTGSGDLKAENFSVLNATILKSGSGDASLNIKNELNLTSSGSGDFNLKGNPPKRQISVTGSGSFNE